MTVYKAHSYIPVSCCLMTDNTGVNHCKHPERPPVPLKYKVRQWWWNIRVRIGQWILPYDDHSME